MSSYQSKSIDNLAFTSQLTQNGLFLKKKKKIKIKMTRFIIHANIIWSILKWTYLTHLNKYNFYRT